MASAFTIELRDDLAEMVRERVASGAYASESEVIEESLDALREDEGWTHSGPEFDRWVREELRPAVAAYRADPSILIPIAEVEARLAERHRRATDG